MAEKINVLRIVNPFDRSKVVREEFVWRDQPLDDYFAVVEPDYVVSVNGHIVAPEDFASTWLAPNDSLVICPVPRGGGDDKGVLRLVAMIAVSMFAPYAAGTLMGLQTTVAGVTTLTAAGTAVAMGINFAGAMLVNALLPPPKPSFNSEADSPSYGIDGPKNVAMEGIPVPVCYGKFRMGGNLVNMYVENVGETQDLYMLFNAGEGPIASITDIEINDKSIAEFKDVTVETRLGLPEQAPIPWFADTLTPHNIGLKLSTAWTTFTTPGIVDKLRFDIAARGGFVKIEKNGSHYAVSVPLEIEYRKQGDIAWTQFAGSTGLHATVYRIYTYDGVTPGMPPQEIQEFRDGELYVYMPAPSGELAMTQAEWDSWGYKSQYSVSGTDIYRVGGNKEGYVTEETNYDPGLNFVDSSTTPVRRSWKTDLLPEGIYETRVRRVTEEQPIGGETMDHLWLEDIYSVVVDDIAYPNTALLGLKIRLTDQLNAIPKVTYVNGGRIIRHWVHENNHWIDLATDNAAWVALDMMTHTRYGMAFADARFNLEAWKDWAAWCQAEGLTFRGVFDTESNGWDQLMHVFRAGHASPVPVGTRWSVAIERETEPSMMFSVANMIERSFRQSWSNIAERANEIEVTYYDEASGYRAKPMRIFDPAQLSAGVPQRTAAIDLKGVVSASRAWKEAMLALSLNRYVKQSVEFDAPLDAVACTVGDVVYVQHDMPQWGYAGRFEAGSSAGVVMLDREVPMVTGKSYRLLVKYDALERLTTTVTYSAGGYWFLNVLSSSLPGPVKRLKLGTTEVGIGQTVTDGSGYLGVHLNDALALSPGATVSLWDTDAMVDVAVTNTGTGIATALTVTGLPSAPEQFQHWMYGETGKLKKPFRIKAIAGSDPYIRTIRAIEYNASVYSITGAAPTPDYSDLTSVDHVTLGPVAESQVLSGGATAYNVSVSFTSTQSIYAGAEVHISRNGAAWEYIGIDRSAVGTTANAGDTVIFKVVATSVLGAKAPFDGAPETAPWVVGSSQMLTVLPPSAVIVQEHRAIGPNGDTVFGLQVEWAPSGTPNLSGYVIEGKVVGIDTEFKNFGTVAADRIRYTHIPAQIGVTYSIRVAAQAPNGQRSEWAYAEDFLTSAIDAPENVTVSRVLTALDDGTATEALRIAWTPSIDPLVVGYEIEYRFLGEIAWINMTTTGTTADYLHTPFVSGKTYQIRVRGFTASGAVSSWAQAPNFVAAGVAAPTNVVASEFTLLLKDGTTSSNVLVTWTAAPDAAVVGYEVEGKLSTDANWTAWGSGAQTRFERTGVEQQKSYQVRVRSYNLNGQSSAWVQAVDVAIDGDDVGPGAPTGLTATGGIDSIALTWTNPTDPDYATTEVWVSATNDRATATKLLDVAGTSATHAGLGTAVVTRYYWVRALDYSGNIGAWNALAGTVGQTLGLESGADFVAPGSPTGLALTSAVTTAANGTQTVTLTATWSAPADADISYYEIELREGAGGYIGSMTGNATRTYSWIVKPNTSYTVRVRAIDNHSNLGPYSATASLISASDATAPAAPTSLTGTASLRSVFLKWMNPGDNDLASIEIWSSAANDRLTATRVAVVNGARSADGGFTHAGLASGTTRYYWIRALDTSNNASAWHPSSSSAGVAVTTAQAGTDDIAANAVTADHIAAGVITADEIQAGSLTGDRLSTTTSLPGTIKVGATGVTIETVRTNAETGALDPAMRINGAATKIDPGKITISGATTLANWRNGSDLTKIEGGSIAANTIAANKLTVGLRGINITGITFQPQTPSANRLAWTAGAIEYTNDAGALVTQSIAANTTGVLWSAGTIYVYWDQSAPTTIKTTTTAATAYGPTKIVLATYTGGPGGLIANYGRTLIDGASIITGSIAANQIAANAIQANHIAAGIITATHIGVGAITADRIKVGDITADRIKANEITANQIAIGGVTTGAIGNGAVSGVYSATATSFGAGGHGTTVSIPVTPNESLVFIYSITGTTTGSLMWDNEYTLEVVVGYNAVGGVLKTGTIACLTTWNDAVYTSTFPTVTDSFRFTTSYTDTYQVYLRIRRSNGTYPDSFGRPNSLTILRLKR